MSLKNVGPRDPGPKINILVKVPQSSQRFPDYENAVHSGKVIYFKKKVSKLLRIGLCWDNRQARIIVNLLPWYNTNSILTTTEICIIILMF